MEDLLTKIYDRVAFYEQESMCLGKEFDTVVEETLEPQRCQLKLFQTFPAPKIMSF